MDCTYIKHALEHGEYGLHCKIPRDVAHSFSLPTIKRPTRFMHSLERQAKRGRAKESVKRRQNQRSTTKGREPPKKMEPKKECTKVETKKERNAITRR